MDDIRTYFTDSLLPGIFLTLFFYCLPVAFFQYQFDSPLSPRRAKIVSAGFAAISFVLLSALLFALSSNVAHASVAWIWCLINYKALTSGYEKLEGYAHQFPYEKRTVYSIDDQTPAGKYLIVPTEKLANVIVTDKLSNGSEREEVIEVKKEREIKLIPGRRVACRNCELKLKSTTKSTPTIIQTIIQKFLEKTTYPAEPVVKKVNENDFKNIFRQSYDESLCAISENCSYDIPELELLAALFVICDFAALQSDKDRMSIAHMAMDEIVSVIPDLDVDEFNYMTALYGGIIRGQKKLRLDWDVSGLWENKFDAPTMCALLLCDFIYNPNCIDDYDGAPVAIRGFSECIEFSSKTTPNLQRTFRSLFETVYKLREQKVISDTKAAVVATPAPTVEEKKEVITEAKEKSKAAEPAPVKSASAESAPGERSDIKLNCREYQISPDYPAGTYYAISNGDRPHLMVVDTKGNTEKRKYYEVSNVIKVRLKPNRIVKCVDCELRK